MELEDSLREATKPDEVGETRRRCIPEPEYQCHRAGGQLATSERSQPASQDSLSKSPDVTKRARRLRTLPTTPQKF